MIAGIDDAAASEAMLLNEMEHPSIILVRVDANITATRWTPVKYRTEYSFDFATRCYAMDGAIWQVIEPLPILYHAIGRVTIICHIQLTHIKRTELTN